MILYSKNYCNFESMTSHVLLWRTMTLIITTIIAFIIVIIVIIIRSSFAIASAFPSMMITAFLILITVLIIIIIKQPSSFYYQSDHHCNRHHHRLTGEWVQGVRPSWGGSTDWAGRTRSRNWTWISSYPLPPPQTSESKNHFHNQQKCN